MRIVGRRQVPRTSYTASAKRFEAAARAQLMDELGRPASYDDLTAQVQDLNLTGTDYLLTGSCALFAHGYHRATRDIKDHIVQELALSALRAESGKK